MSKSTLKKIRIIGGSGSGKSFLAKKLSKFLNIEHCDLDDLFWDSNANTYGIKAVTEIRNKKLNQILENNSWIVEGVYYREWTHKSFIEADRIFLLTPNVYLQHWRVTFRFVKRKLGLEKNNKKDNIKSLIELIRWNHQYTKKILSEIKTISADFDNKIYACKNVNNLITSLNKEVYEKS
ncbi:MAG: DNA topology modulation protein FlaR [Oligoflexia bacterium]|nr:DNA topology modulation protein FlaR [Oligoflexia bacterium]